MCGLRQGESFTLTTAADDRQWHSEIVLLIKGNKVNISCYRTDDSHEISDVKTFHNAIYFSIYEMQ